MGAYDLIDLLEVLKVTKQLPKFWLQFFPREKLFTTEKIAFDEVSEDYRKLAPFVAPNVQGRVQKQEGYTTVAYAPAYVKPKDIVDPNNNMLTRMAGESLVTGDLSPEQRFDATVASLLASQRIKIDNTLEWMAAKVVQDGQVTVDGLDYPRVTVSFNRDASLTGTLAGTAQWNSTAANPLTDIKTKNRASNGLTGATNFTIIMGPDAYDSFSAWIQTNNLKLINNDYRGSRTTIALVTEGLEGVEYVGRVQGLDGGGGYDIWVYSAQYVDEAGSAQPMMDPTKVVGIAGAMYNGVQCFGAIKDKKAGLRALRYFPKTWDVEDPSVTYLMTQSAPLMVPGRVNASWSLKVQS